MLPRKSHQEKRRILIARRCNLPATGAAENRCAGEIAAKGLCDFILVEPRRGEDKDKTMPLIPHLPDSFRHRRFGPLCAGDADGDIARCDFRHRLHAAITPEAPWCRSRKAAHSGQGRRY